MVTWMKYFDISDFKFLTPYEIKDPIWVKSADGVFLKFSKCEGFIDCTRPMKNGNWHTQYQFSRGHKYEHLEFANRRSESSFMFIFQRELGDEEYFTKKITSVDPQKTIHFKTFPDGTREHYYQTDNEAIIEVFEPSGFLRSRTLETHSTEEKCLFSKGYIKSITYKKIRPDETQCTVILFNKGKPIRVVNYIDEFTHQKGSMYRRHQKIIPNGLQAVYRRKKWFIQYRIGDTIIDDFVLY